MRQTCKIIFSIVTSCWITGKIYWDRPHGLLSGQVMTMVLVTKKKISSANSIYYMSSYAAWIVHRLHHNPNATKLKIQNAFYLQFIKGLYIDYTTLNML